MRRRNPHRGSTIIEVMCAAVVLLVAIVGLVGVMNTAASATAVGHRRTVSAHLRQAVLDRMVLTPRDRLELLDDGAWRIDSCFDVDSRQPGAEWINGARSTTFACPTGTRYRTWFRVQPHATIARQWQVLTYAERMSGTEAGCTPAQRFSSLACLGADLLLTD